MFYWTSVKNKRWNKKYCIKFRTRSLKLRRLERLKTREKYWFKKSCCFESFQPWLQGLLPALTSLISSSKLFNLQLKPFIWYRQFVAQCLCNRRSPSYYRSRFTFNGCEITVNSPFMMQEAEGVRLNLGQRYRRHTVRLTRFNFPHENLSLFNGSKFVINAYTRICSQILDHEISWFHLRSITISKKLFIQHLCE